MVDTKTDGTNADKIIFSKLANFQKKQLEGWYATMEPNNKYILLGGAAGGGKSYFLRWTAIGLAMYYYSRYGIERVPIGLFSEDYPTLRDRQVTKIMREFPRWLGELKETNRDGLAFYITPEFGSGVIMLRNLDDPSKYASVEFAAILVEELTKNPETTFEDLRTRLRFPGIEERKFVGATNPGNVGHGWVKRLWITPDMEHPDYEQTRFKFIPAKYVDNSYNPVDYGAQLMAIKDPQKRAALLDGSWDVFAGQYFEEWRQDLHTIKPFVPSGKPLIVGGMDWGRSGRPSHKTAFFASFDIVEKIFYEDISWYRCKTFVEIAGKDKTPREWAGEIKRSLAFFNLSMDSVAWIRGDPAMFTKGQDMSLAISDQFRDEGITIQPASNDRLGGWEVLHKWLSIAPDGLPYWQITQNCKNLIRTIPEQIHDENRPEDLDTEAEDHGVDQSRYMKKHLRWIDGNAGGIRTNLGQITKGARGALMIDDKQLSINTDKFAMDIPFTTSTRVISASG